MRRVLHKVEQYYIIIISIFLIKKMIENIAIIVLAFLTQLNVASDGNGIDHMLDQFIETESINEYLSNDNWDAYRNISEGQEQISPLPYKVSDDEIEINSDSAIAFDVGTDYVLYSKDVKKKIAYRIFEQNCYSVSCVRKE